METNSTTVSAASDVSDKSSNNDDTNNVSDKNTTKGLSYGLASFFLVAHMAGAGFLALPRAIADAGWIGAAMMVVFCIALTFSGTRLGMSWVIIEERFPKYRTHARQPYMEIAFESLGIHGRRLALVMVLATLGGGTTVFILLIGQMLNEIIPDDGSNPISLCAWVLIVGAAVMPLTWLGTPKDFWQASVFAVLSTVLACWTVIIQMAVDKEKYEPPNYPNPSVGTFALGFGTILYAFSGASVFPTVQNDMKDRSQFWKSVIIAFSVILSLYLPVAVTGYAILGDNVESNILLSVPSSVPITVAIGFQIANLICSFPVVFNPVAQAFEQVFNVPNSFNLKRCVLRSSIVLLEIFICLAIPDFGLIVNFIGGSSVTLCSLILPPLMYIRLVDMKGDWKQRTIPLWERVFLIEFLIVGIIGGIISTISALMGIINQDFDTSCLKDFSFGDN